MTPQQKIRQILETEAQAVTGWDPTADELFDLPNQNQNNQTKMVDQTAELSYNN